MISERKCKISSDWASKSLHLFFSKNGHFQQLLAKFFVLFNFNVYPICLKDTNFISQQSVYQNTLLHTESYTKVFLHQGRRSMDHVHYSNKDSMHWYESLSFLENCIAVKCMGKLACIREKKVDLMNAQISMSCLE